MLESIKKELKRRKTETAQIEAAIEAEKVRLEEQRHKARERNPLRKIKVIDNIRTKAEVKRDEKAIQEFRQTEEAKIAVERSNRTKEIARANKGKIAAVVIAVIMAVGGGTGIKQLVETRTITDQYNSAVSAVENGDFAAATRVLSEVEVKDAGAIGRFASILMAIDAYKGNPDALLNDLNSVGEIQNESILELHKEVCSQIALLSSINADVSAIEVDSVTLQDKEKIEEIRNKLSEIEDDYLGLIDIDKYLSASRTIENIENDTNVGKVILALYALQEVTLESNTEIEAIREMYDSLTETEKGYVCNQKLLSNAETKYAQLVKEKEAQEKAAIAAQEAKEKAEREAAEKAEREAKEAEERAAREAQEAEERAAKEAEEQSASENYETAEEVKKEVTYVANINPKSLKFHRPTCSSVRDMSEGNKKFFYGDRQEVIDAGFTPCKRCNP